MDNKDSTPQTAPADQLAKLRLRRASTKSPAPRRPRRPRTPTPTPAAAHARYSAAEGVLSAGLGLDDPRPDDVLDTLTEQSKSAAPDGGCSSGQPSAGQELEPAGERDAIGERLRHHHEHRHVPTAAVAPLGSAGLAADTPTVRPRRSRRRRSHARARSLTTIARRPRRLVMASALIVALAAGVAVLMFAGGGGRRAHRASAHPTGPSSSQLAASGRAGLEPLLPARDVHARRDTPTHHTRRHARSTTRHQRVRTHRPSRKTDAVRKSHARRGRTVVKRAAPTQTYIQTSTITVQSEPTPPATQAAGGSSGSAGGSGGAGPAGPTGVASSSGCNPQCK